LFARFEPVKATVFFGHEVQAIHFRFTCRSPRCNRARAGYGNLIGRAIGAHRAKRAKAVSATPLDDIPGVGATRKRALLAHFGSAKAVGRAAVGDLTAVDGISDTLAQSIYDFFHARG
jgi:hypothetical protein